MSAVDAINVATRDYISKEAKKLTDNVFQNGALAALLKDKARPFPGGTKITENFVYAGMPGGAHRRGARFNNRERQTDQRLQFDPKYIHVDVVLNKIDIRVLNSGPFAVYSLLDSKMSNAYLTMGAFMEIAQYLPGSGASFADNVNGLAEIVADNSTTSFDGNNYATYGDLSRTDANYGNAIKGKVTNVSGPITFETLESTYMDVVYGSVEPNVGQTTPKAYSYIKNKFQTQQRWNESALPNVGFGFRGLKFNGATLMASRYCPGTAISGTSDPIAVDYITETTAAAATPLTAYPTLTSETLWWLNADDAYLHLYISDDEIFGLGFDDFIPNPETDELVGRVRLAYNLTSPGPRYHHQLKGITG